MVDQRARSQGYSHLILTPTLTLHKASSLGLYNDKQHWNRSYKLIPFYITLFNKSTADDFENISAKLEKALINEAKFIFYTL